MDAWLPVHGDPLAAGAVRYELPSFWPSWPGLDREPGILTVSGAASVELEERPGIARSRADRGPDDPAGIQSAFSVEGSGPLGTLRWTADPPRSASRSEAT